MKVKSLYYAGLISIICAAPCVMRAQVPATWKDSLSYAIGVDIATSLRKSSIELNPDMLATGYRCGMDSTAVFGEEDLKAIMQIFQEMAQKEQEKRDQPDPVKLRRNELWLEENKKEKGVLITASGLQYRILREGKGKSPLPEDEVVVHYEGHKIDGTGFDDSYDDGEPATFPLNNVIQGWQEGLQLMKPGAKYELFIPSELAYGHKGMYDYVGPDEVLIFTVELISIKKAPKTSGK